MGLEVFKKKTAQVVSMKKASLKVMTFGEYKELDEACIFGSDSKESLLCSKEEKQQTLHIYVQQ